MGLKEFIPFFKEEKKEVPVERRDIIRSLQDQLKMYEKIINRYGELIEREESKTIADLKNMIKPNDPTIQKIKEEIMEKTRPYIYEQNFLTAAEAAHRFIREIRTYTIPIDFWLTPGELLDIKGGDPMDKATFLCSLLIALENTDSYVIVGMNKGIKVAVGFNFKDKFYIIDPTSTANADGEKEKIINEWFIDDKRVYEFNDRDYSEIKGELSME